MVVLRNPQTWFNALLVGLLYAPTAAFAELWGIPYLEQARGLSRMHAANANAMVFLGWAIGGPCWGLFSDFIRRCCFPIVMASVLALIVVCAILYFPKISYGSMSFLLFVFGLWNV